ncbi:MAG: alpha/beta fold hydrolase [Caldilineaceae bacterium]|nr:alpha/beta fold hydrolase [Caldilineaceae bacterium]
MQLISEVQAHFKQTIPLSTLFHRTTVAGFAEVLEQAAEEEAWTPLIAMRPKGTQTPIFCVHGSDGSALAFTNLAQAFDADRPFYALQARGIDGESAPQQSIAAMATAYIEAIQQLQPTGPYYLGGYSFGGLVAYEMVQQLQQQGHAVALLALFDSQAPHRYQPALDPPSDSELLRLLHTTLKPWLGEEGAKQQSLSWHGSVDEQLDAVAMHLTQMAGIAGGWGRDQLQGILAVMRATARMHYAPQQPLSVRTVLFRAHDVADGGRGSDLGWNAYLAQPIERILVPGDHQTMLAVPHVQTLAAKLGAVLKSQQ